MRVNSLIIGFIASSLLPGTLASPARFANPPSVSDKAGWLLDSLGYLVPKDTPPEKFDINASWMVPVTDPSNRDANETIFDANGFDLVPQRAAPEDKPSLQARATTKFWFGRNDVDMGCGQTLDSIRDTLGEAVYALCKGGLCDAGDGVKYVHKVVWMGGGSTRIERWVEITTMGVYTGSATLGNIHNAVKASVQSESVKFAWRSQLYLDWDMMVREDKCKMGKFPNYIRINKPSPNMVDVQFWIRLNTVEANCLAWEALSVVGGAIHGVVGAAFGAIAMACNS